MKTPLVLHNLLHGKVRTLVAVAGVSFAIILVFMQLGFFASAETTATVMLGKMDFDLCVISANYLDINRPRTFPRSRLTQMQAHPDVEHVSGLHIAAQPWAIVDPDNQSPDIFPRRANRRAILVVGFNPDDPVWREEQVFPDEPVREVLSRLRVPGAVLMDTRTRDYFKKRDPGVRTTLGRTTVTVVGNFTVGTGYGADGMVMCSERTFRDILPGATQEPRTGEAVYSLGLIKLRPQARGRPDEVKRELQARFSSLPEGDRIRILTRDEMHRKEERFWVQKTSVGVIFTMGAVVACIVGTVFVYQVIASDITSNFKEYATLRAMGYPDGYLTGMILRQAFIFSLLGYLPGLLVAFGLYALAQEKANLPIFMTWQRAVAVYLLALLMCMISGYLALARVRSADPADLF